MFRLPNDCLVKTTPELREQLRLGAEWPVQAELLAQLKEELSILTSEHRRKKPIQVPRPDHLKKKRRKPVKAGEPNPEGFAHAIGVLKHAHATRPRR